MRNIIIENYLSDKFCENVNVYCFNGNPKYIIRIYQEGKSITIYDENSNIIDDIFGTNKTKMLVKANEKIKQTINLSKKLSKDFTFVRVDWMIHDNKLYFEELTFTPYSGFYPLKNNVELGNLLVL